MQVPTAFPSSGIPKQTHRQRGPSLLKVLPLCVALTGSTLSTCDAGPGCWITPDANGHVTIPPTSVKTIEGSPSHDAPVPDTVAPLAPVLVTFVSGCSMSSFTRWVAKAMLTAHGYQICNKKMCGDEVHVPKKNPYKTNSNSMVDAMALLARAAKQHNCTCVVKVGDVRGKRLVKDMYATPGGIFPQDWEFGIMFRSNLLDRQVCLIRDNFAPDSIGQSVLPNGTKFTPTEFRGQARANTLAKFKHVSKIESQLDFIAATLSQTAHDLQNVRKRSINQVATEDLVLFEHDASVEALQRSTAAWQSVLASWRAPSSPHVINQVFAKFGIGKRARPAPHADVIYNPKDVQPHLGKYACLWRP